MLLAAPLRSAAVDRGASAVGSLEVPRSVPLVRGLDHIRAFCCQPMRVDLLLAERGGESTVDPLEYGYLGCVSVLLPVRFTGLPYETGARFELWFSLFPARVELRYGFDIIYSFEGLRKSEYEELFRRGEMVHKNVVRAATAEFLEFLRYVFFNDKNMENYVRVMDVSYTAESFSSYSGRYSGYLNYHALDEVICNSYLCASMFDKVLFSLLSYLCFFRELSCLGSP